MNSRQLPRGLAPAVLLAVSVAASLVASLTLLAASPPGASGVQAPLDGAGALLRPRDLRGLVFLSSGHGMAYGPAHERAGASPPFTNVFVTPEAYRSFMQTGLWPDGTAFFLEVRQGEGHPEDGVSGQSQGALLAVEAEVKDSTRYPDGGWAYFDFGRGGGDERAQPLPRTESCYSCHRQHGAVQWTFTQFYPEQFAVAQHLGTVRQDYDPHIGAK